MNMNDKKAIEILSALLKKGILSDEEDEAVRSSIGILGWTSLAESKIKSLKAKREKDK